ncbi:MAG: adenylate/guanylate cyclase domain-containing protein [Saprospiraceae bacterium]|nr:adenylate/guanylate cyclase domain-containing protein [Saprospiraceae bacterium]
MRKVVVITLSWMLIGLLITVYDHLLLVSELGGGYARDQTFWINLVFNLSAAFMGGILGSLWLVTYVNEKGRENSYGFNLALVALSFFTIVLFITVVLTLIFIKYDTGSWPFSNATSTTEFWNNLRNPFHLKNVLVWGGVVMLTQLGLQVNDKFGQGLLLAFINGKYHRPKEEERIFMFVDLISSTSIAEQLGNERYYKLLRDFFADITDSIIYNRGNIYQYVGDEVVVSWTCDSSSDRQDFLYCFFAMRAKISQREVHYHNTYGLVPDFKAAVHYGSVTAGEIGIIKRDLTFSGDVLNTAARILTFCKEYDRHLLISEKLKAYIGQNDGSFLFEKMGTKLLRGKSEKTEIYSVIPAIS